MMKWLILLLAFMSIATLSRASAQDAGLTLPPTILAGDALQVSSSGSGNGSLYIIGFGKVLKKSIQLGTIVNLPAGTLVHSGHYVVILSSTSGTNSATLDVLPSERPVKVSFQAEPSRLPVDQHNGVTGTVYIFDKFGNLIVKPAPVTFQLSTPSGPAQTDAVVAENGAAWTRMNSTAHQGDDSFIAHVEDITAKRVVQQVAGDPCQLSMSAQPSGRNLLLQTAPVRDCSGNPVPDGTIVTFSEVSHGTLSTADVPLKNGIAKAELPARSGSVLSVASGVVLGNQIRWGK
jgi:hypothetical protein